MEYATLQITSIYAELILQYRDIFTSTRLDFQTLEWIAWNKNNLMDNSWIQNALQGRLPPLDGIVYVYKIIYWAQ